MNIYFLVFMIGLTALLLLWLLFYIIKQMNIKTSKKVNRGAYKNQKKVKQFNHQLEYVNIHAFDLPNGIEKLTKIEESMASKSIFKVFKAVDYLDINKSFLSKEWHSWQIGILLYKYKIGEELYIYDRDTYFRKEITSLGDANLKKNMNDILLKYREEVNIRTGNRESLSDDVRWNGREISIIIYFLSKYKEFPKELL